MTKDWRVAVMKLHRYTVQGFELGTYSGVTIEEACERVKFMISRGCAKIVVWEYDDDKKIELHCPPFAWRCECNGVTFKGYPCWNCGKEEPSVS